jgi:hypothetical protein
VGGAFAIALWINPTGNDHGASSPEAFVNFLLMTMLALLCTSLACPIGARLSISRLKS